MTNRQVAAKLVHKYVQQLVTSVENTQNADLAELADKKRFTDEVAEKIKFQANKIIQPFLIRVSKIMTPRAEKKAGVNA